MMHRKGYSLIETVTVISGGAAVFGIALSVLHLLFLTEKAGRNRLPQEQALMRLAEQFREDMHMASRQPPVISDAQWQFALPEGQRLTYHCRHGEVAREVTTIGRVLQRESYLLAPDTKVSIRVDGTLATLTLEYSATPRSPEKSILISATLGKDHRFHKLAAEGF